MCACVCVCVCVIEFIERVRTRRSHLNANSNKRQLRRWKAWRHDVIDYRQIDDHPTKQWSPTAACPALGKGVITDISYRGPRRTPPRCASKRPRARWLITTNDLHLSRRPRNPLSPSRWPRLVGPRTGRPPTDRLGRPRHRCSTAASIGIAMTLSSWRTHGNDDR